MTDALSLAPAEIEQRKRIVGLGPEDVQRITSASARVRPRIDALTDIFFDHLAKQPEAAPLMHQEAVLAQAKQLKRAHLEEMIKGAYGEQYVQQRLELGRLYGRAELPMRVFLGAYRALLEGIRGLIEDSSAFTSLVKLAFFDIGLIADVLIAQREAVIRRQQEAIRELSTPVLQLRDRLLLMPVVGMVDTARARLVTESMLSSIQKTRARAVVIDVTGVADVDTRVAHHLFQTVAAARLMGVRVIVSGLSPDVSQSMSMLGMDVGPLETAGDLQSAVEHAERHLAHQDA